MKRHFPTLVCVIISFFMTLSCSKKDSSNAPTDDSSDNATSLPIAPANLVVANIDASSVKLAWTDASNNEKGFKITRWSMMSGSGLTINVPANTTMYTDVGLGTYQYRYTVFAFNSLGDSDPSNSVELWIGPPISAPTNLQATAIDSRSVALTWTQNSTDFSNFIVERSSASASAGFAQVAQVSSPVCTDNSCIAATTYWYRVYQTSHYMVKSGYSNIVTISTPLAIQPPTNLTTSWSGSGFQLSWTATAGTNITYTLLRRETRQTNGSVIASNITATTYTDATASSGLNYYYSVKAVSGGTNSSSYTSEYQCVYPFSYNEIERNGPSTTLTTLDWCYYMEHTTANKEVLIINGSYSGSYAGYNAVYYKNYDWDLFELTFDNNDIVKIDVLQGATTGLWKMEFSLSLDMAASGGGESPQSAGNPTISGNSYTWNILYGGASTLKHSYLMVSMPDNLINTGPFYYQIRVTITRK
jgi:fibronectin type 3 domain-containing protein